MLRFLLDTDHLTLVERGHSLLVHRIAAQPPGAVGTSAITVEETLRGRLGYLARPLTSAARVRGYALLVGSVRLFNRMPIISFEQSSEALYQQLRLQQLRVGTQDLRIAAVALVNNLVLLTRNRRDFSRIPGLILDDWSV